MKWNFIYTIRNQGHSWLVNYGIHKSGLLHGDILNLSDHIHISSGTEVLLSNSNKLKQRSDRILLVRSGHTRRQTAVILDASVPSFWTKLLFPNTIHNVHKNQTNRAPLAFLLQEPGMELVLTSCAKQMFCGVFTCETGIVLYVGSDRSSGIFWTFSVEKRHLKRSLLPAQHSSLI